MTEQIQNHLSLHLFVETSLKEDVEAVGNLVADKLSDYGSTTVTGIKKYWKIPEYFEVLVEVQSDYLGSADVPTLANIVGKNWIGAGSSMVWNFGEGSSFVDEKVRWANIEYIEFA